MPRTKALSDLEVLDIANRVLHERGPDGLTFEAVGKACGLSPATLVQRFGSKAALKQAALQRAWDGLDAKTTRLAAAVPKTLTGAIDLLIGLSKDYGGIEQYAEGLLMLREDLRDPALRARGARWNAVLCRAIDECFIDQPGTPPDIGVLMASQWQGSLLWWSFDPRGKVEDFVEDGLRRFVAALLPS